MQGTLYNAETGIKSEKVFNVKEQEILQWVLKNRKRAGAMTERFSEEPYLYLSIYAAQNRYGVIGIFIGQKPLDAFENSIPPWHWIGNKVREKKKRRQSWRKMSSFG